MDWGRAKTLLIVAFLLLNLFLLFQYVENRSTLRDGLQEVKRAEIEALFAQEQIQLPERWPEEVDEAGILVVRFVQPQAPVGTAVPDAEWAHAWRVQWEEPLSLPLGETVDLTPLSGLIDALEQYEAVWQQSSGAAYQLWEGKPLFNAWIRLLLTEGEIRGYQQRLLQVEEEVSPQPVLTASTALAAAHETGFLTSGAKVIEVRFGYYGQLFKGEQQVLYPVWRVRYLEEGNQEQRLYVHALNGSVESQALP